MPHLNTVRRGYERFLEALVVLLMAAMFVIVLLGVTFRTAGSALVWYDEIAEILLAWLTYYGAALAALKRAHIGIPTVVNALPFGGRVAAFVAAEACVLAFFLVLAWTGWRVVEVLAVDFLISIPEISTQYTQSVIPIGAALFVVAQVLSMPEAWRDTVAGGAAER
jgi:TRAP-type C4-dicarboxylate transport system permease small subunit